MRVTGSLASIETMEPAADRRETLTTLRFGERCDSVGLEHRPELARTSLEVELVRRARIGFEQESRRDAGQPSEIVEVDPVEAVVLGVVLGALEVGGERRDVHPWDARREKRPDLGPGCRPRELVA